MRKARKLTEMDQQILAGIQQMGAVLYVDPNGQPYSRSGDPISKYRFARLLDLDIIAPQDQSLFDLPAQSYAVRGTHAWPETP